MECYGSGSGLEMLDARNTREMREQGAKVVPRAILRDNGAAKNKKEASDDRTSGIRIPVSMGRRRYYVNLVIGTIFCSFARTLHATHAYTYVTQIPNSQIPRKLLNVFRVEDTVD